jgi:PHAX RNA-binding domain
MAQLFREDPLLALKIAELLNEKEDELIQTIIEVMGVDFALMLLDKVKNIQESGGIQTKNGGKRSPGGTFFYLAKELSSPEESKLIFKKQASERKKRYKARKKLIMKIQKLNLI